ncbi:Aldehyde dehydrogenase domain [Dillenia turbinata]|uniref:Aldehyde dehydrogenase domain n=1 Tax=Dillenia turbinata TaxID=194707 RepID=A0AAN8Z3J9_9MAGN
MGLGSLSLQLCYNSRIGGEAGKAELRVQLTKHRNFPNKNQLSYSCWHNFSSYFCRASLSEAVTEELEKKMDERRFDGEKANGMMKELRESFKSGKTKSYDWRVEQLKGIAKMVEEKENDILHALHLDLSKPSFEAFVSEVPSLNLAETAKTSMTTYPSSAEIVSEPLGVVLIISAWNYPFLLSIDPVIGAIAAGNAVVLKPSELAPSTSLFFATYLKQYVDESAIKVVEGAVPETTALLDQKWDKIFYTGFCQLIVNLKNNAAQTKWNKFYAKCL